METHRVADDTTAQDLGRATLKWLERFFIFLFVNLAVWYRFRWWALIPGVLAVLLLVRSINTALVADRLYRQ